MNGVSSNTVVQAPDLCWFETSSQINASPLHPPDLEFGKEEQT